MNQQNKHLVWHYWHTKSNGSHQAIVNQYCHPDVMWHGFEPLRHLQGVDEIWTRFWQPLLTAMPDLTRRPYHFIGGHYADNQYGTAGDWVAGTGDFAFPDRRGPGHQARIADGRFAASTGWPSLVGTHVNSFMGWPPTGKPIGWNIMDFWKRDGDKLLENWVMIDLIGAAQLSGVDLLSQLPKI